MIRGGPHVILDVDLLQVEGRVVRDHRLVLGADSLAGRAPGGGELDDQRLATVLGSLEVLREFFVSFELEVFGWTSGSGRVIRCRCIGLEQIGQESLERAVAIADLLTNLSTVFVSLERWQVPDSCCPSGVPVLVDIDNLERVLGVLSNQLLVVFLRLRAAAAPSGGESDNKRLSSVLSGL